MNLLPRNHLEILSKTLKPGLRARDCFKKAQTELRNRGSSTTTALLSSKNGDSIEFLTSLDSQILSVVRLQSKILINDNVLVKSFIIWHAGNRFPDVSAVEVNHMTLKPKYYWSPSRD